jgi:hypothetical protein
MMDNALEIITKLFFTPAQGFSSYEQYQVLEEMRKTKSYDIASNHVYVHELFEGLDIESVMLYIDEFTKKLTNGTPV